MPAQEQKSWADQLVPQCEDGKAFASRGDSSGVKQKEEGKGNEAQAELPKVEDPARRPAPFKGIRFSPMAGPGPTGGRPEHCFEFMGVRKRSIATRLGKLLARIVELGVKGALPPTLRWILHSALVYLEKLGKDTPRPIRCGEFLRKYIAKNFIKEHRPQIQQRMIQCSQYGVALQGGRSPIPRQSDGGRSVGRPGRA